ncbi:MAG TPA: VapC toxin family PIN domain ribonuclease, partial [Pedococcus sp.]|nr:VapC toxin family PIN domain ribonuclease [Pedococcus sp.]
GVNLIDPVRSHFAMAGLLPVKGLRSLEALHLITAMRAEADVLVAYERPLIEAAASVGLASISPV